ncbi:phosphoribosylglycinamide formyltransferase [Ktedonosporobacter rubrisoli]|uniref:Phosphoribosylglycinamide formyltransferase n=2 Tax=Ktedonosporobacter rubrisoli TaxID=2509675 RepID=A0A4P6K5S6_KTERU|nr:phosphoribosylglycinamide formyltransferase [Ktedonosporobacter rubrisoli]
MQTDRPEATKPARLAVLVSGSGSNLQALIDALESQQLPGAQIVLVVSNKADAYGLQRALKHRLPALYLPWKQRAQSEQQLVALLRLFEVDLIVLAGWMRIFSAEFIEQFPRRIINLHPALIPDDGSGATFTSSDGSIIPVFRGMHAARQALEAGVKITGSTVHYVTPEVDAGPMLCRQEVPILTGDTEDKLQERIKQVEHSLIVEAVQLWMRTA